MIAIYKYALTIDDELPVDMPAGAEILCVQMQGDVPCVWAKVDSKAPTVRRWFRWRGTGHPAEGVGVYVGTVQIMGARLVFHLFADREGA